MGAPRILLVEDHDDSRELLIELCVLRGHEVASASNGRDAIVLAASFCPTVAFIDIQLPDIDGFAVVRELRARFGSACPRLIALSGWGDARERALAAGFDEFVMKPISSALLQGLITRS